MFFSKLKRQRIFIFLWIIVLVNLLLQPWYISIFSETPSSATVYQPYYPPDPNSKIFKIKNSAFVKNLRKILGVKKAEAQVCKRCNYSENGKCYQGTCLDDSTNCGIDNNCSYQNNNGYVCPGNGVWLYDRNCGTTSEPSPLGTRITDAWALEYQKLFRLYAYYDNNGEIVFYDQATVEQTECSQGCIFNNYTLQELIFYIKNDEIFISTLAKKLYENGYNPYSALTPYFNIEFLTNNEYTAQVFFHFQSLLASDPNVKQTIDEYTLSNYIQQVRVELKTPRSPMDDFIAITDPFFGTRAIYNVLTLPPNQVSDNDRFNVILGIAFIAFSKIEKGISFSAKLADQELSMLDYDRIISDVNDIRTTIKQQGKIPAASVTQRLTNWTRSLTSSTTWSQLYYSSLNATRNRNILPLLKPGMTRSEVNRVSIVQELVRNGEAFVLEYDAANEVILRSAQRLNLLGFSRELNSAAPNWVDIFQNGWVIIIESSKFQKYFLHNTANASYRTVVVSSDMLIKNVLDDTLTHEFIHVIAALNAKKAGYTHLGRSFIYDTDQADFYGKLMSIMYEYGTEHLATQIKGTPLFGYRNVYPNEFAIIDDIMRFAINNSKGKLGYTDLMRFALTGDDIEFSGKMIGTMGINEFRRIVQNQIGIDRLNYLMSRYRPNDLAEFIKSPFGITMVAGLSAVALSAILTTVASGEELPPDTDVIFPPLVFSDQPLTYEPENPDIFITGIEGNMQPGAQVNVSSTVTSNNLRVSDTGSYERVWVLEAEPQLLPFNFFSKPAFAQGGIDSSRILPGGQNCGETCTITIPTSLNAGTYRLSVYLTRIGGGIQASDSQRVILGGGSAYCAEGKPCDNIIIEKCYDCSQGNSSTCAPNTCAGVPFVCGLDQRFHRDAGSAGQYGECTPACSQQMGSCSSTPAGPSPTPGGFTPSRFIFSIIQPPTTITGEVTVQNVTNFILSLLVTFGIIAALAYLLYGGIKYITSGGVKDVIENARQHIMYAIIGLLVIILSFVIIRIILSIIGANTDITNLIIPSIEE